MPAPHPFPKWEDVFAHRRHIALIVDLAYSSYSNSSSGIFKKKTNKQKKTPKITKYMSLSK